MYWQVLQNCLDSILVPFIFYVGFWSNLDYFLKQQNINDYNLALQEVNIVFIAI